MEHSPHWWHRLRQWLWRRQAQAIVQDHRTEMLDAYHRWITPRPYPTDAEWAAFRLAIRETLKAIETNPNGFIAYPVLGSQYYHWAGFGEERTEIRRVAWTEDGLALDLSDGRRIVIPPDVMPILRDASSEERDTTEIHHGDDSGHEYVSFPLLNAEVLLSDALAVRLGMHDTSHLIHMCTQSDPIGTIADLIRDVVGPHTEQIPEVLDDIRQRLRSRQE